MNPILTYNRTTSFEQQLNTLHKKEGHSYTDAELRLLPETATTHPRYKEWKLRSLSLHRLLHQIKQKGDKINILEVGCGNGWLAAKLAAHTKGSVTGIDINYKALQQARRAFQHIPNLQFISGNLQNESLTDKRFDIIVFAASVQYFPSLKKTIQAALQYLTLQGEIHITDTPFYGQHQLNAAGRETKNYFTRMGCREMTAYYFHHGIDDLEKFNTRLLYDPRKMFNRWFSKYPFFHIVIKNQYQ